jgi:cytidylate kinase
MASQPRRFSAMPIITIYQGASGEGQELAESVAADLGYRCVGREVLVEAGRRYRIPEAKLNDIVEKGPHWWDRLLQDLRPYRIALQAALCELAQDGKVVYHGHVGHELLPGIGHVLKVLLTAPIEFRVQQIRARQKLTDTAARHFVDEVDKARSRRLMAMFGTDWRDPNRFDLILNMERMRREGAKRMIVEAEKLEEYQPTPESKQAFDDLSLASRVHAMLFTSPDVKGSGLEVRAEGGHVHVKGRVEHGLEDRVVNIVKNVPGVIKLTTDLYSVPPEAFLGP